MEISLRSQSFVTLQMSSFRNTVYIIEDAMRRDTAAPSILGLAFFVIRFGMWRLAAYTWRLFGGSRSILADLGRSTRVRDLHAQYI